MTPIAYCPWPQACIKAKIDVLGVATAEAEIQATATVDLAKGQVHATAKANAKVEAGPIKAESKVSAFL